MPQVAIPNGLMLGPNGGYIFMSAGNPNSMADPQSLLANCLLGSLFIETDSTPALWQKTGAAVPGSTPTGVWTQIS